MEKETEAARGNIPTKNTVGQRSRKTNKNDGEEVQGCGKIGWWMREGLCECSGFLQIPKGPIERESAYVLHMNPMTIIDVIWCVVVESEKSRLSDGAGADCGFKRTLDIRHPIRPQGQVLGYERERLRHLAKKRVNHCLPSGEGFDGPLERQTLSLPLDRH